MEDRSANQRLTDDCLLVFLGELGPGEAVRAIAGAKAGVGFGEEGRGAGAGAGADVAGDPALPLPLPLSLTSLTFLDVAEEGGDSVETSEEAVEAVAAPAAITFALPLFRLTKDPSEPISLCPA